MIRVQDFTKLLIAGTTLIFRCFALAHISQSFMKNIVTILRVLVGLLFIFSGLIKANDPLGLSYKMDEYFAVWHWDWATPYSLWLSMGMNVLEIASGVVLILGIWAKANTRLLLGLIVFFTFLTGYAVVSGRIKTCGCFGDCIPLQAWQSFVKDLILLALIAFLAIKYKSIGPLLPANAGYITLLIALAATVYLQIHVLKHLPLMDCLPYAKGKKLMPQMQVPAGSQPDSVAIFYTYKKAGVEVSFDASHFPQDFNDTVYSYVKRENVVVRKGNAEPAIKDFALFTQSGNDTTTAILNQPTTYLLYFAKNFNGLSGDEQEFFSKLYLKCRQKNIPLFVVTNEPDGAEKWFNASNHFAVPVLNCDGTVMKTVLRGPMGIVAMKGDQVMGKWNKTDMNDVIGFIIAKN